MPKDVADRGRLEIEDGRTEQQVPTWKGELLLPEAEDDPRPRERLHLTFAELG